MTATTTEKRKKRRKTEKTFRAKRRRRRSGPARDQGVVDLPGKRRAEGSCEATQPRKRPKRKNKKKWSRKRRKPAKMGKKKEKEKKMAMSQRRRTALTERLPTTMQSTKAKAMRVLVPRPVSFCALTSRSAVIFA